MKKTIVLILFAIFLFSCAEEELKEVVISTYVDETPMVTNLSKWVGNEQIVVKEIRYFPNGEKEAEICFNDEGQIHGTTIYWHDNGEKWLEENYVNDVKSGDFIEWYKSGKKSFQGTYKNGLPDGKWTFWDENGKKMSSIKYKNGKKIE